MVVKQAHCLSERGRIGSFNGVNDMSELDCASGWANKCNCSYYVLSPTPSTFCSAICITDHSYEESVKGDNVYIRTTSL